MAVIMFSERKEIKPIERVHVHANGHVVAVDVELLISRSALDGKAKGEIIPAATIVAVDGDAPPDYLVHSDEFYLRDYGIEYDNVLRAANKAALARVVTPIP